MVETEELRFHLVHGQNAVIVNNGRTATRPNATGEFNDAIIMSNRPLKDNELFEIIIEKMVDRWSGSIEAGMSATTIKIIIFWSFYVEPIEFIYADLVNYVNCVSCSF